MYTEIIVNSTPNETRVALLEDQHLVELFVERADSRRIVGNIYKGRVESILPGMQATFIDIGLDKSAFLHVSDVIDEDILGDVDIDDSDEEVSPHHSKKHFQIQDVLKKGQDVLIQIAKEPIGDKGPRATSIITLAGRYIVLMPTEDHIGISRKIEGKEERRRLKAIIKSLKPEGFGVIVRTEGAGKDEKQFKDDIREQMKLWEKIKSTAEKATSPALIHKSLSFTSAIVRDIFSSDVDSLVIDSHKEYKEILAYLRAVSPQLIPRVKLYDGSTPIFDAYDIEKEISKTLDRKVWLKKGGYIIIDYTEAMVVIDVNTGRYTGKKDPEETVLETNLEAAKEIARQLRLRDLGGIIVIDFIDMEKKESIKKVYNELVTQLKRDRSKTKVYNMSELGLIEMTRKRVRPALIHTFCDPCPACNGTGRILSSATIITKIERTLKRIYINTGEHNFEIKVNPWLANYISSEQQDRFSDIKKEFKINIKITSDPTIDYESFKIISESTLEDLTSKFS